MEKPAPNHENSDTEESDQQDEEFAIVEGGDRMILEEEEEREKLLTSSKQPIALELLSDADRHNDRVARNGRKERRSQRRRDRKAKKRQSKPYKDEGELMYEMEQGVLHDRASSESSTSMSDSFPDKNTHTSNTRRQNLVHFLFIPGTIISVFALYLFGAYKMSGNSQDKATTPNTCNSISYSVKTNGTSNFAPTTILISLDGFRADFLNRGLTPTLNSFIGQGVSPKYMLPSFPSLTFPNHYTLVTGLYPESHGVVGNTFWDPHLNEEFYYTDTANSMQPKWWNGGEPLWVTAEHQNVKTAIHMWPGSEAHFQIDPTYLDKFNGSEVLSRKVNRILEFLDFPSEHDPGVSDSARKRPQFIAAYVPNIDAHGHLYGPNSTEIRETISKVDTMLHDLFEGLQNRNLSNIVNIVVVSDHGMATTSTDRLIQFDDLIDPEVIEHIDGWPLFGLRPKATQNVQNLYEQIKQKSTKHSSFDVYLKDKDMPARYHFVNNDRIAPLWIVPKAGWAIVKKAEFNVKEAKTNGDIYYPRGLHGYDHENSLMRALFVARGPAFPHQPGSQVEVFRRCLQEFCWEQCANNALENIEVYNMICDSLGIQPKPNNGTLRLPLKPVGLHSDKPVSAEKDPVDFPSSGVGSTSILQATPKPTVTDISRIPTASGSSEEPNGPLDHQGNKLDELWAYVMKNVEAAKEWWKHHANGGTGQKEPSNDMRKSSL